MTAPLDGNAPEAGRSTRYTAFGTIAVLGGALTYVGFADPHRPGAMFPGCPFKALTGWDCPGCGGLRMTHDLLHADLPAAVVDNVFLLVGLPLLAAWLVVRWRLGRTVMPVAAWVTVVGAAVIWTVVRNQPGFPLIPTMIAG